MNNKGLFELILERRAKIILKVTVHSHRPMYNLNMSGLPSTTIKSLYHLVLGDLEAIQDWVRATIRERGSIHALPAWSLLPRNFVTKFSIDGRVVDAQQPLVGEELELCYEYLRRMRARYTREWLKYRG